MEQTTGGLPGLPKLCWMLDVTRSLEEVRNSRRALDWVIRGLAERSVDFVAVRDFLLGQFQTEEAFMESVQYPELAGHRWQHRFISDELTRVERLAENGESGASDGERLICELLEDHRLECDGLFADYCVRLMAGAGL